jgi:hypothetical protein
VSENRVEPMLLGSAINFFGTLIWAKTKTMVFYPLSMKVFVLCPLTGRGSRIDQSGLSPSAKRRTRLAYCYWFCEGKGATTLVATAR